MSCAPGIEIASVSGMKNSLNQEKLNNLLQVAELSHQVSVHANHSQEQIARLEELQQRMNGIRSLKTSLETQSMQLDSGLESLRKTLQDS
ncbi:MAG: hypothetical protein H7A33_03585 [Deltaproteobacteria bacterium]|nr:hypothetical protein [Deltaproteobacteria bacterium]